MIRPFLIAVLLFCGLWSTGQVRILRKDTVLLGIPVPMFLARDSSKQQKDAFSIKDMFRQEKNGLQKRFSGKGKDSTRGISHRPTASLRFTGGYVGYNFNYRSDLDTPYTEKNMTQHQVVSTLNFVVADLVPIRVNTLIRRSNSLIFQNITDVQVAFDAAAYRNQLSSRLRDRLLKQAPTEDSVAGKLYHRRLDQAANLQAWLKDPLTAQKLIEANEIVKVPHITYNVSLPDTTNKKREDSLRKEAALLLALYDKANSLVNKYYGQADSLKQTYDKSVEKADRYRQLANMPVNSPGAYSQNMDQLQQYVPGAGGLSKTEQFLLGVRNFGVGRNSVNYSDLTAKNISMNGVNFEYNSWYYLAFSAGVVDYRFRDFVIHRLSQTPQYLYLARVGLGRLEKNYLIVSGFGGQKQLLTSVSTDGTPTTVKFTGLSTEAKWRIEKNVFVQAEVAQSFSPDLQSGPPPVKPSWSLSDRSNKAMSFRFYSFFPATNSRLEAQYKFTGANYQSFTTFQTNAEQKAWYIKGEQNFFNRQLKLVASIRSNDFTNPYIVQNYSSNTIFKSLSLTFHRKKLPIVSISYMPMSQLTKVDSLLEQSQFHTLNISISHFYKLGNKTASTNIVYTKFFNGSADTGFIYYNSVNLYMAESIFFRDFTATLALSHSQNTGYQYNVLEGNVTVPLGKRASLGGGAKLNNLNETFTGVGGFIDGNVSLGAMDRLSFHLEKGYLPGSGTAARLVPNVLGTISFIKSFK